ncbi:MAG: response regulator receiver protein [Bryobacterales bacterium]|nr:response regulator receiver protein [Bryobacterales bacterium]
MTTVSMAVEDPGLINEVRSCLEKEPVRLAWEQTQVGDLSRFLEEIRRSSPDLVLIDVGSLRQPVTTSLRALRSAAPQSFLVALNTRAEPSTLLDCFHSGANEYLVPPLGEGLQHALHNRLSEVGKKHVRPCRVIAFLSSKGGSGATTIACHAAVAIARQNQKVLLADFDIYAGEVGFLMGAKSPYSTADAFRNTDRLDSSYWGALVSQHESGVDFIAAPSTVEARREPTAEQAQAVLNYARTCYEFVVLDLGAGLSPFSLAALGKADELCLVLEPAILAVHQARNIIQTLRASAFNCDRLHAVVNRVDNRMAVSPAEMQQVLAVPVFAAFRCETADMEEALANGELLPPGHELSRRVTEMVGKLIGCAPEAKKSFSLFGRRR